MLHILWLILKFILILLGILLGLVLLAVLLLLFCPVRYRASAVKEEGGWKQIQGSGTVSWLFRGISLRAEWKDGEVQTSFYLFGIPVSRLLEKYKGKKVSKPKKDPQIAKTSKTTKTSKAVKTSNLTKPQDIQNTLKVSQSRNEKKAEINEVKSGSSQGKSEVVRSRITVETEKKSLHRKLTGFIQNKLEKIRQKLKKIRQTLQKIRSNVHWWKDFLEHPRVKAAISLVWKHAKFLLKHIFPTRTEGKITFSCEDPALTGMVLAVLGMTIPFHKNCIEVVPLFNGENDLRGNISVKGRIYGFVFVRAAIVIYFDKNIKYVIKRWKTRRA